MNLLSCKSILRGTTCRLARGHAGLHQTLRGDLKWGYGAQGETVEYKPLSPTFNSARLAALREARDLLAVNGRNSDYNVIQDWLIELGEA